MQELYAARQDYVDKEEVTTTTYGTMAGKVPTVYSEPFRLCDTMHVSGARGRGHWCGVVIVCSE